MKRPDPAVIETVKNLMTGDDALTVPQILDDIRSRLAQINVHDDQAILDILPLIDFTTALVHLLKSADLKTRNEAAKVKLMAERTAGKWINLHPESLD